MNHAEAIAYLAADPDRRRVEYSDRDATGEWVTVCRCRLDDGELVQLLDDGDTLRWVSAPKDGVEFEAVSAAQLEEDATWSRYLAAGFEE